MIVGLYYVITIVTCAVGSLVLAVSGDSVSAAALACTGGVNGTMAWGQSHRHRPA